MELSNKLKQRQIRLQYENEVNSSSDTHSVLESNNSENEMSVGEINIQLKQKPKHKLNICNQNINWSCYKASCVVYYCSCLGRYRMNNCCIYIYIYVISKLGAIRVLGEGGRH